MNLFHAASGVKDCRSRSIFVPRGQMYEALKMGEEDKRRGLGWRLEYETTIHRLDE